MADHARARALCFMGPGKVEIREAPLAGPAADEVLVQTLWSGISRGTERLVLEGRVPPDQHAVMRAPFQEGEFAFPVKYGYAAVGVVEIGPPDLTGRTVFALHPHQDRFVLKDGDVHLVPEGVPARRAVLAANMETALNIVWDAEIAPGDRVTVIGAGVVGLLAGYLAGRIPGTAVTIVDVDARKGPLARTLGLAFADPGAVPSDQDVAINASASEAGLLTAFGCVGFEGRIVEASWYGDKAVTLPLGGRFHSDRLRLISSQVGHVGERRSRRFSTRRRLGVALGLLSDDRLDGLVTGETAFQAAPAEYPEAVGDPATLCHILRYVP